MASKKYLFLTVICSLLAVSQVFGQTNALGNSHDYLDTNYVSQKNMIQQRQFLNNESIYPSKPRDMWEVGVFGGYNMIFSDVRAQPGFDAGLSLRKALGYVFSLRADFTYGQAKGVSTKLFPRETNIPGAAAGSGDFYPDYKMTSYSGFVNLVASLNNILFHKENNKVNWYLFGGVGGIGHTTKVDAFDGSNSPYAGTAFTGSDKKIVDQVKDAHDGTYETTLVPNGKDAGDDPYWNLAFDAGMGVAFRISPHFNVGVEQKFIFSNQNYIVNTIDKDIISQSNIRLNFNLGNDAKRTEPLYWQNPLGFAYGELNQPRHMQVPVRELPDADGDGVTDQFDKCPNTPAGVPVDVNGCPLDTDGDGVPDYRDKELITPTYCQPVDEDGVGKCPTVVEKPTCDLGTLPTINFSGNGVSLSNDAKSLLGSVANQLRESPACRVVVSGHAAASKVSEQLAWDRVNAIINYMTEKEGIPSSRFIFKYQDSGDANSVDLRSATQADNRPNRVAPPHPNLRRSK